MDDELGEEEDIVVPSPSSSSVVPSGGDGLGTATDASSSRGGGFDGLSNNATSEMDVLTSPNNWGMSDDSVVPSVSSTMQEYLAAVGSKNIGDADDDAGDSVAARTRRRAVDADNDTLVEEDEEDGRREEAMMFS